MNSNSEALILFVDDDPFTLETLSKAALVLGHRAIVADTCESALAQAAENTPDLIFTDIRLSDVDGINLVEQLKSHERTAQIPVIVLSASPEIDVGEGAHAAGAIAFLHKPVRLNTLQDVIQMYTSRRS